LICKRCSRAFHPRPAGHADTGGLIGGMLLFLVAAGLSLIFGTLKVVNFMRLLYMLEPISRSPFTA
jgi:hypothetical protein